MATRKRDVLPETKVEDTTPQNLPNATPDQIVADEWAARVAADTSLDAALADIGKLTRGDEAGAAFTLAKAHPSISMDHSELVEWFPGSTSNAVEKRVVSIQEMKAPDASPAYHSLISNAMFHAVCASRKEIAEEARNGNGSDESPDFGNVRKRSMAPKSTPADKVKKSEFHGDEADARKVIVTERDKATKAGDKQSAAVWQQAFDAIDSVELLRRMGNDLAAVGMAKGRWRRIIYTKVCASHLDEYAAANPKKKIGTVWTLALGKAAEAHGKYMSSCIKAKATPNADELAKAIDVAVWDNYLEPLIGIKAKVGLTEEEEQTKVVAGLWRAVDAADSFQSTGLAVHLKAWIAEHSDRAWLARPAEAKRNAQRAAAAEAEAKAKADAEATAEAEANANAEAKAERARQRADAKGASGPQARQQVVTPATGKGKLDALRQGTK